MLPRPRPPQRSALHQLRRQLRVFQQPIVWGTAVLLLSGLFLVEYWQPRSLLRGLGKQSAFSNREANPTLPQNPLPNRSSSDNSASYRGGELPGLAPALPGQPNVQIPIDPTLPLPSTRSSEDKTQQTSSRTPSGSTLLFGSGVQSESASERSADLYNPTGIPAPQAWQRRSTSRIQTIAEPSVVGSPTPTEANAVSPLQSALDRVNASGNSPVPSEAATQSGNLGLPQSVEPPGAIEPVPLQPTTPYPQPTPRVTGYTTPPAFRTPENTAPFYRSPTAAPSNSQTDNSSQPETVDPLVPSSPVASPSADSRSNFGQPLGGREINTFSNP